MMSVRSEIRKAWQAGCGSVPGWELDQHRPEFITSHRLLEIASEMADRIEELDDTLAKQAGYKNDYKAAFEEACEDLRSAEAKLAKAVEALIFHNAAVELCIGEVTPAMIEAYHHTKRTLAELTGGKDR